VQVFLREIYLGNSVLSYLVFLATLAVSLLIIWIFRYFVLKRMKEFARKSTRAFDHLVVFGTSKYLVPTAYAAILYADIRTLHLSPFFSRAINVAALAFLMAMAAGLVSSLLILAFTQYWSKKHDDSNKEIAVRWIAGLIRVLAWSVALVLMLDNVGVKINSLIAGLGIGGVAIAFAAQSIITDVFCFFTIFFDRPFEIGDFIITGEQKGTVEHIGIKTTRLRSIDGEQLVFSNTDLTSSRIRNFKTLEKRRILFTIGVNYDTPLDQLKTIPGTIQGIIEKYDDVAFERAHFVAHATYSLNFEIVYHVLSSDYIRYADIHQAINFQIREAFDTQGIRFAYLTQTPPAPTV
jgi:small-conductance mechanosensitive channel